MGKGFIFFRTGKIPFVIENYRMDLFTDDSKSQAGYLYILNGGAVSWCSCKQSVVAGSTCEAEYMAASEAALFLPAE